MLFLVWASMNAIFEVLKNTTKCVAEISNLLGDWVSLEILKSIKQHFSIFAWHTLGLPSYWISTTLLADFDCMTPYVWHQRPVQPNSGVAFLPWGQNGEMWSTKSKSTLVSMLIYSSRACHRKEFCTVFCLSQISWIVLDALRSEKDAKSDNKLFASPFTSLQLLLNSLRSMFQPEFKIVIFLNKSVTIIILLTASAKLETD